jgi:hypothetical protein
MSLMRSWYKELGLEIVSIEEKKNHDQETSHGGRKEIQWDMRSFQNVA